MENYRQHAGRQQISKKHQQENERKQDQQDERNNSRTGTAAKPHNNERTTEKVPSYMFTYNEDDWQD